MATFGIATVTTADAIGTDAAPKVDTDNLCRDLAQIRNSLDPLLSDDGARLSLSEVTIGLTLSATGKVLFISEATVEASITLTFSRPE